MLKTFPRYEKKALKPLFETFKSKDKKAIEDFLVFCGGTGGKTTIAKYRSVLTKICDVFGGDLDNIDLKRLRSFLSILNQSNLLPPTKNEVRKVLKRFLKENYEDWNVRFKQLKDIKGEKDINQDKINANTILREEDIEALVRGETNLKYKAMIMLFFETAGRPEEILKLMWKDINLDKGEIKLKSSKTGNLRINPIQNSIIHLKRYREEYPFRDIKADDFVFPCVTKRETHLTPSPVGTHFKRLSLKILGKPVFPYLIRHTRATQLQKILPAKIYEKFMDHSIETATRYSHLNKEDVREYMFKNVYKVNEVDHSLGKNNFDKLKKEIDLLRKISEEQKQTQKIQSKIIDKMQDERKEFLRVVKEIPKINKKLTNAFSSAS